MSDLTCRLIAAIPEDIPLNRVLRRHREHCLRCQADDAKTTGVSRNLSSLETETLKAPEGLATDVMIRLGQQDGSDPRRPLVVRLAVKWATTGVVVLASAVALAAGIVSRLRRSGSS